MTMVTKNGFGAHFLSTDLLSEKFGHPELLAAYGADSLPLFALTPNERLRAPRTDTAVKPDPGWTIIRLLRKRTDRRTGKHEWATETAGENPENGSVGFLNAGLRRGAAQQQLKGIGDSFP